MGNTPKVHYIRTLSWSAPGRVNVLCGSAGTFTSEDPEKLTCKTCRKLFDRGAR